MIVARAELQRNAVASRGKRIVDDTRSVEMVQGAGKVGLSHETTREIHVHLSVKFRAHVTRGFGQPESRLVVGDCAKSDHSSHRPLGLQHTRGAHAGLARAMKTTCWGDWATVSEARIIGGLQCDGTATVSDRHCDEWQKSLKNV